MNDKPELPPVFSDSDEMIRAMQQLLDAREKAKSAKTLEDDAKNTLDRLIRDKGLSTVQAGGYVCTITEQRKPRFDSAEFKKIHPELVNQFTKESISVIYTVKEA